MDYLVGAAPHAKYDCGFLDKSGNFVGLMLVRNKYGVPAYQESADPAVADQYFTGLVNYGSLQSQKELQEGQNDWRAGFGLEYQDSGEPKRYYMTKNVDARFKGMVVGAPRLETITVPNPPTVQNAGFEQEGTDAPLHWTKEGSNGGITLAAPMTEGEHSVLLSLPPYYSGTMKMSQVALNWNNGIRNVLLFLSVDYKKSSATGSGGQFILDDGVDTTTVNFMATSDPLTAKLTHRISPTATQIKITFKLQSQGDGASMTLDNLCFPKTGAVGNFCVFNSSLYYSNGGWLFKIASSSGTPVPIAGFDTAITSIAAYKDKLYIALGKDNNYYTMNTDEEFTETNSKAELFRLVGDAIKKTVGTNVVYSTVSPPTTESVWDTGTVVGNSTEAITDIVELEGLPCVLKEDMPYLINITGEVERPTPSLISEKRSTSGRNAHNWQNKLYIPCGEQALYEYDGGILTDISPSKNITGTSDFSGRITALASDAQWLFAYLITGTTLEVLAGRWENVDGDVMWVWHPLISKINTSPVNCAVTSTVYQRRVWLGLEDGNLLSMFLPSKYGDITSDTSYQFSTRGDLYTCWFHSNLMGDQKTHYKISLIMRDTSANEYWKVYYQKLGDTYWTYIGDCKTSPVTTLYIPKDSQSKLPASTMFRYKFTLYSSSSAKTPVLMGYDVRGVWYPFQKKIITMQVRVADGMILRDSTREETQTARDVRKALEEWQNPETAYPRAFFPLYWEDSSDTLYAKVYPTPDVPFCQPVIGENGEVEWVYNIKLLVVEGLSSE